MHGDAGSLAAERAARPLAAVRDAARHGARLHPRGAGLWWRVPPPDANLVDLTPLDAITRIDAADLVATAEAGCRLDRLTEALAKHGAWLALDPPGPPGRTLGGVLASGGAGPLAAGFGAPRDQVLGLTFIAGNGALIRVGGRVVKNVAGFDLAKAVIGAHGAFGVIVATHLRLRARPEADRSLAWGGSRERVAAAAADLLAAGAWPAALEVVSPELAGALGLEPRWTVLVRSLGVAAAAAEELDLAARSCTGLEAAALPPEAWSRWSLTVGAWPVVVRIGAEPAAWTDAWALATEHLAPLGASVTVPRGTVRIGAVALPVEAARSLRAAAAGRGWPVTLERADPATRAACGVWGALEPGLERLTRELRRTFDPGGVFAVPLLAP